MTLENQRLAIPHAFTSSDKIDAGLKGIIDAGQREGVFYVRHGKLDAILEVRDGERDIDIIRARKKFDGYSLATDTDHQSGPGD
jgi:RNA binding exosome subunit